MNYELDERYTLLPFAEAGVGEQDIVDMWEREGVVDRRDGADRAREAICVGIDREDGLVAVTTAYLDHSTQLRTQMWLCAGSSPPPPAQLGRRAPAARDPLGDGRATSSPARTAARPGSCSSSRTRA